MSKGHGTSATRKGFAGAARQAAKIYLQQALCRVQRLLGTLDQFPKGRVGRFRRSPLRQQLGQAFVLRATDLSLSWRADLMDGHPSETTRSIEYVRVLPGGECVSVDGTHLGWCRIATATDTASTW